MPFEIKVGATLWITGLLPIMLWVLRPSQRKPIATSWFRLREKDPIFRCLFKPEGTPRKYTWLFALLFNSMVLGILWLLPTQ